MRSAARSGDGVVIRQGTHRRVIGCREGEEQVELVGEG